MKTLLITTAFLTAPLVSSVTAQTSDVLKRQISEQNRQIGALEDKVTSLQSQLNLERKRNGKTALPVAAKNTSNSTGTHIVKSGDTFSGIARSHGVSVTALIAANKGVSPKKLAINQKLVIPQVNNTAKPVTKTNTTSPTTSSSKYTVKKGDTFYGIAKDNKTTVAKLIAMNPSIKPTNLKLGQVINISATSSSATVTKKTTPTKSTKVATAKSKPTPKPTVKPTPRVISEAKPKPKAPEPVKHTQPTNVAKTMTVTSVMTYGQFASKHGTTISVLNAMNGLDLPTEEPMAVGSALYVPSR